MSSVLKNYRKIYTSPGGDPSLPPRVTILENNEYKVTYYEVIQGTSGTLVVPSQGTINSDEFGLSGNAILSKIDANNKPTYESPTTVSGAAVTASLNVLTGAWVASGVYTDPNVALIYSIKIKAIYYSNLTYNNIIETIDLAVTKTSDLINDGDDGVSHFISLNDLPSNLILYATTAASDIPTYVKLVSSITDPSYNAVAVNVSTGAITGANQFISALVTTPNIIVGNPGVLNISTIGNIRRTSGTGNAEFYFEVWKRNLAGTETLITTSGNTPPVFNGVYSEFSASAVWNDGIFLATDRIVLKFYGSRVAGGSNPTYDFQFGGSTPVRSLVPLPLTVIPVLNIDDLQDVTIASVANNEILTYESSTSLWKNKTVVSALGFNPVPYTGATANVDLGTNTLFTPLVQSTGTLTLNANGGNVVLKSYGSTIFTYTTNGFSATPVAASSGFSVAFSLTKPNNTNQTASSNIPGFNYLGGSRQWLTGAITTQSENVWGATTYSFVGASTIDTAYGNVFNAPIAGTNATITNNYAAHFTGNIFLSGGNRNIKGSNGLILETGSGSPLSLRAGNSGNITIGVLGETSGLVYSGYFSSGAITNFNFNKSSSVNQTASTAIVGWNYIGNSRTWLAGNITTQNENVWGAVTYNFGGASTITNAYGNVFNAPIAGTNCTITNNFSAQFNGKVQINGNITSTGAIDNQYYLNIVNPNLVATAAARIQVNNGATFSSVFSIGSNGDAVDPSILYLGGSNKGIAISSNSVKVLKVFDTTRNFLIQDGGTFTDNGFKLDVNGTGRFKNTLTLATGTTAIAPLKLIAGTNLTTPVSGSFEFDGTNLYFTVGGVRKTVTLI
jgi:hypothetical protein